MTGDGDRRRRRRERDHGEGGRARRGDRLRRRLRGKRQVPDAAARAVRAPRSCSSSPTSRAATRGCSPRATTRTSASAAGRARARSSAIICGGPARRTGSTPSELEELRGHRLPLRRPGTRIAGERALLVGDAAGLIDPVSGDGMYECFVSSRLAAAAILDLLGRPCVDPRALRAGAVDDELAPLHRASWKLKQALDRWPRASWQIARSKLLWVSIRGMLDGDLPDPTKQRGLARVPLRALAILGRGAS